MPQKVWKKQIELKLKTQQIKALFVKKNKKFTQKSFFLFLNLILRQICLIFLQNFNLTQKL